MAEKRCSLDEPTAADFHWMDEAIVEAALAVASGDVPVGAVLVAGETVVSRGHNRREQDQDPTAHAEVVALRQAAAARGRWHLEGTTLYVTLEPCPMCAGALVLARVDRLVFGAADPRAGAAGTLFNLVAEPRLNHRLTVVGGVREQECAALLRQFFQQRR